MMKKLLLGIGLLGLMQFAPAAEPVDVTATYLGNYTAPFETTGETLNPALTGTIDRFVRLASPWITEGDLGTMGVDYTSWHVDFQKSPHHPGNTPQSARAGAMALTPGWDGFAGTFSNMKVFQTVTLPAAYYEFIAQRAQDWDGAANAYLVASKGTTLTNIENLSTALGSTKFSTAVTPNFEVITTFVLTEETKVSLGAIASFSAAKSSVTLADFKLFQLMGISVRPLSNLITKYKAYTTTQYPVIGTYAEPSWTNLQGAIALAETFVSSSGSSTTQEELDTEILALNSAATVLDSMARLPKLVVTTKALTNVQYPIGIVMGTYPQAKWDAFQAAIGVAQTFIERSSVTAEEIETNRAALQLAIDNLNESMVLPFKVSDETDSYWYQIRDMRNPMNFMQMGEYDRFVDVEEGEGYNINVPIALILSQEDNPFNDEQLFKMVKAEAPSKGYLIYNKVIEETPLSLIDSIGVLQINPDSVGLTWQFGATKSAANYTIYREGLINKQLNSFASYTPPYVSFYYPGAGAFDNGNAWEFIESLEAGQTDFSELKALVASAARMTNVEYPVGTGESQFPVESWNAFVAARSAATNLVAKELEKPQPTQVEVDNMVITLQAAIDELKESQNDGFYASTDAMEHWYTVNDKRDTKSYWKVKNFVSADSTIIMHQRLMMVKNKPAVITDSLLFKLVKAEEPWLGYYIYSKLDVVNPIVGQETNMIGVDVELPAASWLVEKSANLGFYIISLEETAEQMNSYVNSNPTIIGFWDGGSDDPGNNWKFTPAVPTTSVKNVKVSDIKVYVINRMIIPANQEDRLIVYNIRGQRMNINSPLTQGVYIVRAEGKQTALKVIVR